MSLRTKILLTYATGITLLWAGLFWLRHAYPAAKHLPASPAKTGDAISPVSQPAIPSSSPMTAQTLSQSDDATSPGARVEAYIRDWHANWKENAEPHLDSMLALAMPQTGGNTALLKDVMELDKRWKQSIRAVHRKHCADYSDELNDLESSMGSPPSHDPAREQVTKVEQEADAASVTTVRSDFSTPTFNVYQLARQNGSWFIRSINHYFNDASEAGFTDAEREDILAQVTSNAALPELDRGVSPNCDRLFEEGRKVTFRDEVHAIRVHAAGKLSVPSGALVLHNLGQLLEDVRPLTLRIPPGDYELEYAEVDHTVIAARLILDPSSPAVMYRPAPAVDARDHEANVGSGHVAISDAGALMRLTKREHEEHYQDDYVKDVLSDGKRRDEPTFIRLGNPPSEKVTCIALTHDGGCPCYWGLNAEGKPVSLILDFMVVAEYLTDRCKLPWPPDGDGRPLSHPILSGHGVVLTQTTQGGRVAFHVSGKDFSRAIWRSGTGAVVADTESMGFLDTGRTVTYSIPQSALDKATEVEVELDAGYRN